MIIWLAMAMLAGMQQPAPTPDPDIVVTGRTEAERAGEAAAVVRAV